MKKLLITVTIIAFSYVSYSIYNAYGKFKIKKEKDIKEKKVTDSLRVLLDNSHDEFDRLNDSCLFYIGASDIKKAIKFRDSMHAAHEENLRLCKLIYPE